jgi:hypothetical protein
MNILYNFVLLYTYIVYYLKKLYMFFKNKTICTSSPTIINTLVLYKGGVPTFIPSACLTTFEGDFDFMIYSDNSPDKILYSKIPLEPRKKELCTFSFISISVQIKDKTYLIKFENYYIVGNTINKYVISYLIKNQHSISQDIVDYSLDIIDHNVNMLELGPDDEITFELNTYSIKNYLKKID